MFKFVYNFCVGHCFADLTVLTPMVGSHRDLSEQKRVFTYKKRVKSQRSDLYTCYSSQIIVYTANMATLISFQII